LNLPKAKLERGKYFQTSVKFEDDGKIFLVKGLPLPWNKKLVGTFQISPTSAPPPKVSMRVNHD
jgi:hypothetical protein